MYLYQVVNHFSRESKWKSKINCKIKKIIWLFKKNKVYSFKNIHQL